jgi:hypothetical protein
VNLVQQNINPELRLTGIVMTMFDPRTKLSEQVVDEVRRFFGDVVYDVIIPRTVRLSEAPGFGQPITVYDPRSKGAETYRKLAKEVAARPRPEAPMPVFDELPTVVVTAPSADETEPEPEPVPVGMAEEAAPEPEPVLADPGPTSEVDQAEPAGSAPEPSTEQPGSSSQQEASAEPDPLPAPPAPDMTDVSDLWDEGPAEQDRRVRPPRTAVVPGTLPERRVVVIGDDPEIDIEAGREPLVQTPNGRATSEEGEASDIGGTLQDEGDGPKRRWRLFRKGGR